MLPRLLLVFFSAPLLALSSVAASESEWQCKKNRVNGQWECAAPDSQRRSAKTSAVVEKNSGWFADTFSASEENVLQQLNTEFDQDPWAMCSAKAAVRPVFAYDKSLRETEPTLISADTSEQFDKQLTYFLGDIDLVSADRHVMADHADHNKVSGVVDLYGDVVYSDIGTALYSDSGQMGLKTNKTLLRDALFILPDTPIRGSADVIYHDSPTFTRLNNVSYTGCPPGNQDWVLHASKMKANDETGRVSIKNGWLEFKKVPLLYLPYGNFPIDDRRLTGLLMPTFGMSQRSGFDFSLPFYWNMAPNYDLIFTPRYMSKRGFQLGTDFRYLWNDSHGEINVEMLPEDQEAEALRWGGSFQHVTKFTPHLTTSFDANYVSDNAYFTDLDGTLGVNNRNQYLKSQADLNYSLSWLKFNTHIENYQNINPNQLDRTVPYRRLPQLTLGLSKSFKSLPIKLALDSEYVYFQRHFPDGQPEGQRLNLKPSISLPFSSAAGFIKPKVAFQHTQYWLEDGGNTRSLSKTLPLVSVDGGLYFERDFASLTHTIEPRLFYLYVPYTDQSDLPNFDTSTYDFNTSQLFRDNEFSGVDKTQNTNQLTTALTTRLMQDGRNRLKLTVGEIFYFAERKVNLSGDAVHNELLSNLIAEFSSEITRDLQFSSAMQWSHKENAIDRGSADLHYSGFNKSAIFNIGYRYRLERSGQAAQEQVVASTILPIYDGWSVVGLYRYSLRDRMELEHFFGVEKDTCCWRFRIIARKFIRSTVGDIKPENSIFFQLELKGFTSLGEKLEDFMQENIYGYRKPTN